MKKAITPLLVILFFLGITATALSAFMVWNTNYNAKIFTNFVEEETYDKITFVSINSTTLTVRSFSELNIEYQDVKMNTLSCGVIGNLTSLSYNFINISTCLSPLSSGYYDVALVTDKGVVSERYYLDLS